MKLLTLTALTFAFSHAMAQSDYRPGFVITLNHDSVPGLVSFRDGGKSHDLCHFKTSGSEQRTTYTPNEITCYGFTGDKRFESKTIKTGDKEESYFLEVVATGKVTLYQMRDRYWVQKEKGALIELENNIKDQYVDGQRVMRYDNKHIATLNMLFADCPKMANSMRNLRLDKRSLTTATNQYNKCVGAAVVFQEEKPWVQFDFGAGGGMNFSTLEYTGSPAVAGVILGTTKSNAFMFGVTLDAISPRVSERLAVTTAAYYSSIDYVTKSNYATRNDYLKIDLDQVKVPIGIKYLFTGRRIVPYLNAGASFTFNVKSKEIWYEPAKSSTIEFLQDDFEVKTVETGFWGGLGVRIPVTPKLGAQVEVRYEHTNGLVAYKQSGYLESPVNNLQALLAIRF